MTKKKQIIKAVAKKESVMGKMGDAPFNDPMEPWSAKYDAPIRKEEVENLNESPLLYRYLRSLGHDPKFMSFADRSNYARTKAFKRWKIAHQFTIDVNKEKEKPAHQQQVQNEEVELYENNGLLMKYIQAKGVDPNSMDGNAKSLYSKSSEFKRFKNRHHSLKKEAYARLAEIYGEDNLIEVLINQQDIAETSGMGERADDWDDGLDRIEVKKDKKKKLKEDSDGDCITMNIPLFIRLMEYAREDAKDDMDLHKVAENLTAKGDKTLTMDDYDDVIDLREHIVKTDGHYKLVSKKSGKSLGEYPSKAGAEKRERQVQYFKHMKEDTDTYEVHRKGNVVAKVRGLKAAIRKKDKLDNEHGAAVHEYRPVKPVSEMKKMNDTPDDGDSHITREGLGGVEDSPLSATNSVKAMESKKSKPALLVKSIHKKKVQESTYDWEKDDKGGAASPDVANDSKKPIARILMKGGKTMTGKNRDTVEIDPVLKARPNQFGAGAKPGK